MNADEAKAAIARLVSVTRPDVVAAKSGLISIGQGRIDVANHAKEWAGRVAPAQEVLRLYEEDVTPQIREMAAHISAQLACFAAVSELVRTGIVFHIGAQTVWIPKCGWTTIAPNSGGSRGGVDWRGMLEAPHPEHVYRASWLDVSGELWDSDLYLHRLGAGQLHAGVERALRMSLECFRSGHYVPSVAMLGAASEGAWIELGTALGKSHPSEREASKLVATLKDLQKATRTKIADTAKLYARSDLFEQTYAASGVTHRELTEIAQWSDLIRESRNVLHWQVEPTVPNSYEKVAILLLAASQNLTTLHRVRDSVVARRDS